MTTLQLEFVIQMHKDFEKLRELYKNKENWKLKINEGINLAHHMIRQLDEIIQSSSRDNLKYFRLIGMRTSLIFENSKALKITNEVETAETILDDAYKDIKPIMEEPEIGYVMMCIISHLSYYLHSRNQIDKAGQILEDLEIFYYNVVHKDGRNTEWYTPKDLFMPTLDIVPHEITKQHVESMFINDMKLLRCVYYKQGNHEKYALYEHYVLSRELNISGTDILEWSNASIRLALFLMAHYKFKDARHHLAAAFYVLNDYMNRISAYPLTEPIFNRFLEIQKVFANIARGWGKYGIFLFNVSKSINFKKKYGDMPNALDSLWEYPLTGIDINNNNKNIHCSFSDRNNNFCISEQIPKRNEIHTFDKYRQVTEDTNNAAELNVEQTGNTEETGHKTNNFDQQLPDTESKTQLYVNESDKKIHGLELATSEDIKQFVGQCDQKVIGTSTGSNNKECGSGDIISTKIIEENISSDLNTSKNDRVNDEKIETLFVKQFDSNSETDEKQVLSSLTIPLKTMVFTMLDLSSIENRVTHEYIVDASRARSLSVFCYDWLKKYKDYYSFSAYPMHYVYCVLDLSEIYRLHAYFEDNIEIKYTIQKWRMDSLETLSLLLKDYHPELSTQVNTDVIRELAEVQMELLKLNMDRLADTTHCDASSLYYRISAFSDIHSQFHSVLKGPSG